MSTDEVNLEEGSSLQILESELASEFFWIPLGVFTGISSEF